LEIRPISDRFSRTVRYSVDRRFRAGDAASRRLHREVNITRVTPEVWNLGQDLFGPTLKSRPLLPVALGEVKGEAV